MPCGRRPAPPDACAPGRPAAARARAAAGGSGERPGAGTPWRAPSCGAGADAPRPGRAVRVPPPAAPAAAPRTASSLSRSCRAAAPGRSAGSLARQARMSGASCGGTADRSGSSWTTRYSITSEDAPDPNGVSPVSAYARVAPKAKTSVAGVTAAPRTCSGARKPGEPTAVPTWVRVLAPRDHAMPKSMIRGPRGESRMLEGLRSRWTTPASCTLTSPSASAAPIRAASGQLSGPSSPTRL